MMSAKSMELINYVKKNIGDISEFIPVGEYYGYFENNMLKYCYSYYTKEISEKNRRIFQVKNIELVPLQVSISQDQTNENGWWGFLRYSTRQLILICAGKTNSISQLKCGGMTLEERGVGKFVCLDICNNDCKSIVTNIVDDNIENVKEDVIHDSIEQPVKQKRRRKKSTIDSNTESNTKPISKKRKRDTASKK